MYTIKKPTFLYITLVSTLLAACGASEPSVVDDIVLPIVTTPTIAIPTLRFTSVKTFQFNWTDISNATHYKLLENKDGNSGFIQVGNDIPQGEQTFDHIVPLYSRVNAEYILQTCNDIDCSDSDTLLVSDTLANSIGYFKASNTEADDLFGSAVSLSADGHTLAVGAWAEASNANIVNGNQADNSAIRAGAVYLFNRSGSTWIQQAYIKASNAETFDSFGRAVSLSADGNTLAVSASNEDSNATTINGDQTDNSASAAGAVYVFNRNGTNWSQQAYIKPTNTETNDFFGHNIHLSADSNTLAVVASKEASNTTGINGDQTDNSANYAGAVYIFSRSGANWSQQAYIKASNTEAIDDFGDAISLSADGNTLAVGAGGEDSNATGINGDQTDNSASAAGAAYVFSRNGINWSQQAYIKPSNTESNDFFGSSAVSLSADGNTLAVGAVGESSNALGINGDQADNSASFAGAVYIFSRNGSNWSQLAYLKASNTTSLDDFGVAISLSADGNALAVGASGEGSKAIGINGDQTGRPGSIAGAVYMFSRISTSWMQQAYIKASNTDATDRFGDVISLSADGNTLAVGASNEDSIATGINGNQTDNSANNAGVVYLY